MAATDSNLFGGPETSSDAKARLIQRIREEEVVSAARGYLIEGWQPIPIPSGEKAPCLKNWPDLRVTESSVREYFPGSCNIGLLTGKPSGGLVDVDLDCAEAIAVAQSGLFLPATEMIHGRMGSPASHRWYIADPLPATTRWQDPDGTMLCELRSTGSQTVVPPSIHPGGERYRWEVFDEPARVKGDDLVQLLGLTASLAMLVRRWPKEPKNRHELALSLAGMLLESKTTEGRVLSESSAKIIVQTVAQIAGDEEVPDRLRAVADTAKRLVAGMPVIGGRRFVQLMGEPVHSKLHEWLRLREVMGTSSELIVVRLSDIEPEPVAWLWPGHIPLGKLTLIEGDPESGKSYLTIDLAARLSTGRELPDGSRFETSVTVFLSAEDGLKDTVVPRLIAAGGDRSKVVAIPAVRDRSGERLPDLSQDIARLEDAIQKTGAKLVVIDPLNAYLPDTVNTYSDHHIRRILTPLAQMAERQGVAVMLIRHLNKTPGGNPMYRGGGSIGIIAAARVAFLVAPHLMDNSVRVLACVKSNLGLHPASLAFRLAGGDTGAVRLEWLGETDCGADQLLSQWEQERPSASKRAEEFLRDCLSAGPVPAEEVKKRARDVGVAERTLERAKGALGVRVERRGFGRGGLWYWSLPAIDVQQEGGGLCDSTVSNHKGRQSEDGGQWTVFDPNVWRTCPVHGMIKHRQNSGGARVCPQCDPIPPTDSNHQ